LRVEGFRGSGFTENLNCSFVRSEWRKKSGLAKDYGLKGQIQEAAGSSMHNIAEGFDSETNPKFVRFLRYAKRSCTEDYSAIEVQAFMQIDVQSTKRQAVL
jgi:four helix bundle protein